MANTLLLSHITDIWLLTRKRTSTIHLVASFNQQVTFSPIIQGELLLDLDHRSDELKLLSTTSMSFLLMSQYKHCVYNPAVGKQLTRWWWSWKCVSACVMEIVSPAPVSLCLYPYVRKEKDSLSHEHTEQCSTISRSSKHKRRTSAEQWQPNPVRWETVTMDTTAYGRARAFQWGQTMIDASSRSLHNSLCIPNSPSRLCRSQMSKSSIILLSLTNKLSCESNLWPGADS